MGSTVSAASQGSVTAAPVWAAIVGEPVLIAPAQGPGIDDIAAAAVDRQIEGPPRRTARRDEDHSRADLEVLEVVPAVSNQSHARHPTRHATIVKRLALVTRLLERLSVNGAFVEGFGIPDRNAGPIGWIIGGCRLAVALVIRTSLTAIAVGIGIRIRPAAVAVVVVRDIRSGRRIVEIGCKRRGRTENQR